MAINKTAAAAKSAQGAADPTTTDGLKFDEIDLNGAQQAYERYMPMAAAVGTPLKPFRLDPFLAYHNARSTVETVLACEARIPAELPAFDLEAARIVPMFGLGLVFATQIVERYTGSTGEIGELVTLASESRDLLLTSAEALAKKKLIPSRDVKKIREGRGYTDLGNDCIALAALFREHSDAVAGKCPITASDVAEASDVGTRLLTALRPSGALKPLTKKELEEALDIRDRFWTLLSQGYDRVRNAGGWLFAPEDWDEELPRLLAHAQPRRRKANPADEPPTAPAQ